MSHSRKEPSARSSIEPVLTPPSGGLDLIPSSGSTTAGGSGAPVILNALILNPGGFFEVAPQARLRKQQGAPTVQPLKVVSDSGS